MPKRLLHPVKPRAIAKTSNIVAKRTIDFIERDELSITKNSQQVTERTVSYPIPQQIWPRYRTEKQCNRRNDCIHNQPDCMFTPFCRNISAPRFQHKLRIECRRIIKLNAVLVANRAQER